MTLRVVSTLVFKDLGLYLRDQFLLLITGLSLVIYVAIYWLLPSTTTDVYEVAVYPETVAPEIVQALEAQQMELTYFADEEKLLDAVEDGDYRVGFTLQQSEQQALLDGQAMMVQSYFAPDTPDEQQRAFSDVLTLSLDLVPEQSDDNTVIYDAQVVGNDVSGTPIAQRDRLLPLFAVLILLMETMALANLLITEIERHTIRALLITPMKLSDLVIGKSIAGIAIAFVQAMILVAVTGSLFNNNILIISLTLLLGAGLVTGVGFLIAAVSRDLMSVIAWSTLAIIVLSVPAITVLFPGILNDWIQIIPTYYLADTLHLAINFEVGWSDVSENLLILLLSASAILVLGTIVLERKLA